MPSPLLSGPSAHRFHRSEAFRCSMRADRWLRAGNADRAALWNSRASKHEALGRAALRGWERCLGCAGSGITQAGTCAGALCQECNAEGYLLAYVETTGEAA